MRTQCASATLTAMRIDTLLLCGLSAAAACAQPVDAVRHGFRPIVVRDARGDRDPRPHEANPFDVQAEYGDVISLGRALASL